MSKKIGLWIAAGAAAIVVSYLVISFIRFDEFRARVNELSDVHIGESREEILYRLRSPLTVGMRRQNREYTYVDKLPSSSAIDQYDQWYWDRGDFDKDFSSLEVGFSSETNTVDSIRCSTSGAIETWHPCVTASGVGTAVINAHQWPGDEDTVLKNFGQPDRVSYSGPHNYRAKILAYDRFGLIFKYFDGELILIEKRQKDISFPDWLIGGQPAAFDD